MAVPLRVSCRCAHGYPVLARPHGAHSSQQDVDAAAGAWKARLIARGPDGSVSAENPLSPCNAVDGRDYGGVCLGYVRSLESGTLEVVIDQPAPAGAPDRIEVYVRNHLCGLERMPAVIERVLGFSAGFLALVAAPFVPRRSRIRVGAIAESNAASSA